MMGLNSLAQSVPDISVTYSNNVQGDVYVTTGCIVSPNTTPALGGISYFSFRVENVGAATLNNIDTWVDGPDADCVTINGAPNPFVNAGSNTQINTTFVRKRQGPLTATLHITSNDPDEGSFDLILTDTPPALLLALKGPEETPIANHGPWEFGSLMFTGLSTSAAFTLTNTSGQEVSGLQFVKTGTARNDYTITPELPSTLAAGASVSFTAQYSPVLNGLREIYLNFSYAGPTPGVQRVRLRGTGVRPTVLVERQPTGTTVVNGATLDLGSTAVGTSKSLSVKVTNTSPGPLSGISVARTGTHADELSIVTSPAATLAPGEHTFVTVDFVPGAFGPREAVVSLISELPGATLWSITLKAAGLVPEIKVEQPAGFDKTDGGTINLGPVNLGGSKSLTFTIKNTGSPALTGLAVTKDGEHADEFVITQDLPVTEVAPGGSTTFTVLFTPAAFGTRTAALHISSNDADENPFDINLTALGSAPEIRLEYRGNEIPQHNTYHFGSFDVKTLAYQQLNRLRDFAVENLGNGPLTVDRVEVTGPQAAAFNQWPGLSRESAPPGQGLLLRLIFEPTTYGLHTATVKVFSDDADEPTYEFNVTGMGLLPGFQIEQPADTPVTSPYTRQFGLAAVKSTGTNLTFTIKNPGSQAVTLYHTITGADAANFTVVEPYPTYSTPGGSSTTLTVQFSPRYSGACQATLNLTHNAVQSGQGSFQVHLSGTGVYSEVEFTSSSYNVNHGETGAAVTVKRNETRVPASVELKTFSGSYSSVPPAESAYQGEDFTGPTGPAAVVNFAVGEAEKTVTIPLLAPASGATETRQFRVELANPGPGVIIRHPDETLVRIVGLDSVKPTLTLTAPAAGKSSTVWPLVVSGKAGDAKGIDRVEVKLGSADPMLATLSDNATKPTEIPFTCGIHPPDGTHTLVVTAYDLRGNSTSVTRSITFSRRYQLLLRRITEHSVGDPQSATFAMTATPAASATAVVAKPWSTWEYTSAVAPGTKIKLVATAKKGFVFGAWSASESAAAVRLGNEVTFTMPSGDVTAAATLYEGSYAPEATSETISTVHWLLSPPETDGVEPAFGSQAYLTGTITATGGLTGKLLIGGQTLPVVATLYGNTPAVFTVAGKKRDSLPVPGGVLTLTELSPGTQTLNSAHLMATLKSTTGEVLSTVRGEPAMSKAYATLLNSNTKGTYTLRLTAVPADTLPTAPAAYPGSPGYATMTLAKSGAISLAGMLADGTAVTMSTALLSYGTAPLYMQLPTPGGTTKLGLVTGTLAFFSPHPDHDVTARLHWYRPAAATSKVFLYTAGWPGGIHLDVGGALYSPAISAQSLFGTWFAPSPARLLFTGGKLTSPIEKTNFGLKGNTVVKTVPVDNLYTLAITPATGVFSGTFTPNWNNLGAVKPAFKGVILQKGTATATGFFLNNAKNEPAQESGSVTLSAPAR